jgi:glycosyltransferase involved in cell wall biosynthesis
MKILFLPSLMTESNYGGLTHQRELVTNLSRKAEVYLIPFKGGLAVPVKDGHELPVVAEEGLSHHMRYAWRVFRGGSRSIKTTGFDLIYARHGISTVPALLLGRLRKVRVVIEVNGILEDEHRMSGKGRIHLSLMRYLDRLAFTKPARVVTVTSELKEHIIELYGGSHAAKIDVVRNGVNTELFRPMDKAAARKTLGLPASGPYICFVGSLSSWQGVDSLITAFPEVMKEHPDVRLIIVGDGDMRSGLERQASHLGEAVIFTGTVPNAKVPTYIAAGDVCVLPKRTLKSGYSPLKLYEYISCGRPVVVSRNKGLEIVEGIRIGILTEPDDPSSLASGIIRVLSDEKEASEMGRRGREYVERECGWDRVAERVLAVCERALKD